MINIPLKIDALIASLDKKYMGSDGMANGIPAFQWDFEYKKGKYRVYFTELNTNQQHEKEKTA